jgi:hypothetical protein
MSCITTATKKAFSHQESPARREQAMNGADARRYFFFTTVASRRSVVPASRADPGSLSVD